MLIKNIKYNGVDLSAGNEWNILIKDSSKTANYRTLVFDKENFHGSRTSNTLGSGRLFILEGQIFGATFAERQIGVDKLNSIIKPEGLPTLTNRGFYELNFEDWNGKEYKTQAKVYRGCEYNHETNSPIITFRFELFSENFEYFGLEDKTLQLVWDYTEIAWDELTIPWDGPAYSGVTYPDFGVSFDTDIPFALNEIPETIDATNSGNFVAKCKIQVIGEIENPRIVNLTNNTKYKLERTTQNLVIDNRGRELIVEDEGVDVKQFREPGSTSLFLSPGLNQLLVFGDNANAEIEVYIDWNDSYHGN